MPFLCSVLDAIEGDDGLTLEDVVEHGGGVMVVRLSLSRSQFDQSSPRMIKITTVPPGQLVFCISLFSIFTFFAVGSYNICLRSPSIQLKGPHSSISISIPIYLSFDFKLIYWPQVHTIGDIMIDIGDSNPKITDTLNR